MSKNKYPMYTIGHASRSLKEFISLLKNQNVTLLVDVRSVPRSRNNPEYNTDVLPITLKLYGIKYLHIPELGGFRAKSKIITPDVNSYWEHNSFHSYADYAMSDIFQKALKELLDLSENYCLAIMCAEILWWRCHRRIITDYLLVNGKTVFHIIAKNNVKAAQLTKVALINDEKIISYPQC